MPLSGTVSGTYTAYAASRNTLSNCESSLRTPVTVTVYGLPSAPAAGDVTTCYDGAEHTGSATGGVGETIVWYTAPTGGSLTSAPSGTVSGTYTAYAASRNTLSNCESSLRTPVTVTVYGLPSAPTGGDVTTCYDGAEHTGSATGGVGETIVWYTAPTGGSLTSAPSGTVSGTYTAYAASRNTLSNCESSLRTPVTVTVYGLPSAPAAGDVTTCYDGAEHTGSATGGVGETIVWYTAPTGGSLTSAPSGTVSGTYTAYAASRNTLSNCESSLRIPVTVTVYGLPSAPAAGDVTTCYDGAEHTGSATGGVGETIVWYTAPTGGSLTSAPSGTVSGTYTAYAASRNTLSNCESSLRTPVTVTVYGLPSAPAAGDVTTCYDGAEHTGSATGGVGETIVWYTAPTGGSLTSAPSGTVSGTYTAYAASRNTLSNCESSLRIPVTVTVYGLPSAPAAGDVTTCYDGAEHTGSATGGVGETIVWYTAPTGGSLTSAPSGTVSGTYTAYAASRNTLSNCESSLRTPVTVTVYGLPSAPAGGDVTTCYDGAEHTGSATGGVGETIVWYTAPTGGSLTSAPSGTVSGTYTAYAASRNTLSNCESSLRTPVTVTVYGLPSAPTAGDVTTCYDGAEHTGSATGGVGETIVWYTAPTGGSLTSAPSGTVSGTYTAYAASRNTLSNCESSLRTPVTVTVYGLPSAPTAGDVTTCYDGAEHTGSATGGVGETIVWYTAPTGGSLTSAPSGTVSGTYTAYAASRNTLSNCESSLRTPVTVTVYGLPSAPAAGDVTTCYDGAEHTGSATGGVGETIVWYTAPTGGSLTSAPSGTVSGTYTAYAASRNTLSNCESSLRTPVTVTVYGLPSAPTAGDVTTCYDGAEHTGSATGGVGETIVWYTAPTGGSLTSAPSGTVSGTYTAYAASRNTLSNCESSLRTPVTVTVYGLPSAPTAGDVTTCYDGAEHTGSATGGVGETIVWYTAPTGGSLTSAPSGTVSGTYTAYAASRNTLSNCESSLRIPVTVTVYGLPSAPTAGDVTTCYDGAEHTGSATGGVGETIVWYTAPTGGSLTSAPSGTVSGTYTAYAASRNTLSNCESSLRTPVTVTVYGLPSAPAAGDVTTCYDGAEHTGSATGGVGETIVWYTAPTGGSLTSAPSGTVSGTYTAYAASRNTLSNCESSLRTPVTVTVYGLPSAPAAGDVTTCYDGAEHTGSATGGVGETIVWYTAPTGGSLTSAPSGTVSGTYTAYAASRNTLSNCESSLRIPVTVTVYGLPSAPTAGDVTTCYDGAEHTGSATGGVGETIVWYTAPTGGSLTSAPSGTVSGTYTAYAASRNTLSNCESSLRTPVTVTVYGLPSAPAAGDVTTCYDGAEHTGSATGGVGETIVWYTAPTGGSLTSAPSGTVSGTYTAYAASRNTLSNCESSLRTPVTVTVYGLPSAPAGGDVTTCYDGAEHTGSATGGVGETIVWYTAPTGGSLTSAPSGTVSGTYTAYAASRNTLSNCESSLRIPVTVTVYGLPSAPAAGDVTTCYDGAEHTGSATGGVGETIVWYTAPTGGSLTSAPSGTVSGTYTAYAASRNTLSNCESSLRIPVTVTVYGLPSAPTAGDVTTCYDGAEHTGSATGGVGETIVWYTAPTGGSLTSAPSGTVSGTYTAYAASRNTLSNCESSLRTPVTVTVYGLPSAPAAGDVTTCYDGAEHTGSATGGVGETIVWYTAPTGGSLTSAPSGTVSGTYTAYAASRNTLSNCESSLRTPVTVTVYGLPSAPAAGDVTTCYDGAEHTGSATGGVGETIVWYTAPTGGSLTSAPSGTVSGTYTAYAASRNTLSNCESSLRTPVTVTVYGLPSAPAAGDVTTCYDGAEHTGSATGGVGETIVWYTAPTGGSLTSAPSGTVSGTYTAYAASRNTLSNCESSLRTPVTVTVYGLPSAPTAGDVTTCYDGAEHTGSATGGVGETIVWYTAPTGGSLTSAPSGTVSGTYTAYAASRNTLSNCESSLRTPVTVTVYGLPSAPAAGDVTTCYDGAEHTGSATGGVGETIVWYTAPTGGSLTSAPSGTVSGT